MHIPIDKIMAITVMALELNPIASFLMVHQNSWQSMSSS
jgi:hypothetical protein